MARFLKDSDYEDQIKNEIRRLLDGSSPTVENNYKLLQAELKAISQIRKWIGGRFDCDEIFSQTNDARDYFIIMIVIDMTLYHLYAQTPHKDVPEHRKVRYQDAIDWIQKASTGEIKASDLPTILSDTNPSDFRIFSSKPPENHDW